MKIILAVGAIASLLAMCTGYSYIVPADPNHPGVCMYSGNILKQGVNQLSGVCQNLDCKTDGSILVEGCGKIAISNCKDGTPVDLMQPFPDCCKMKFICVDAKGNEYEKEVSPLT